MIFLSLVRNELQKTWRSRWIVFAVIGGIFVLIAGGLYTYYVIAKGQWSPPAAVAWQTTVREDLAQNQQQLNDMEQAIQQGSVLGDPSGFQSILSQVKQQIAFDQFLLDHNIAPVQSYSITLAALFALGGIVMFLLIRIFGWLAAEQIAGERSDRTIAILLSRPTSRNQVLFAKATASFLISLAVVVVTFLVVYAIWAFVQGSLGPVTGDVAIPWDSTKPVGGSNLAVMPIPVFVLMCLGGAMLGVLCAQSMSLLVSAIFGRWAAIGITLAVLFGAPLVSAVTGGIIDAISQDPNKAHFLNYAFVNVLAPVSSLTPVFGNGPSGLGASGVGEFQFQVSTLAVWTVGFLAATWLVFRHKQESS